MFRPNITCTLIKSAGTDMYAQEGFATPVFEKCAIVHLRNVEDRVSSRAISSGIRGHGWEWVASSKFLLTPTTKASVNDKLVLYGTPIRITSMFPRLDLQGRLDHYEVEGEYWGG